jgi:hypothetical protein
MAYNAFDMVNKLKQLRDEQGQQRGAEQYRPPSSSVDPYAAYIKQIRTQPGVGGLLAGGAAGAGGPVKYGGDMDRILGTIRKLESGGNYTAKNPSSTASGAYQFLDSSWAGYGGYRRAADAPAHVQDAKAREYAQQILDRNGGDVSTIPVSWYIGHVPKGDEWDRVPAGGNTASPRAYQSKWMGYYNSG